MQWISVKEKRPKKLHKVLFYYILDKHMPNIAVGYNTIDGWNIYLPYSSFDLKDGPVEVTHWAELPDYPDKKLEDE
jgi:uncharacterized protein DUF551